MKCSKFPDRDAAGICAYSGKPYSAEELIEVNGKMYAKDNLGHVMTEIKERHGSNASPTVYMNAGGGAAAAAVASASPPYLVGTKSRVTAILLAIFLGGIGAHKFYVGQWIWGILYLIFCWTGIPTLIGWLEALNYMFMSDATFWRRHG